MNYFRKTALGVLLLGSLNGGIAAPLPSQLKNASIIEERSARERLKEVQKHKPNVQAPASDKLKEAIVQYNAPQARYEALKFELKQVVFIPKSQLISEPRLNEIVSKYLHKNISFNDVQRLRVDIINEYQKLGYSLSTANVPAQKILNDKLTIELIESKIKRIKISGNNYLPDNYFDAYVGKFRENYFNVRDLENALLRFNKTSKANMVAKSEASDVYGYSDLIFDVYEPSRWTANFSIDNYGTKRTGEQRFNASIGVFDVSNGLDDNFVLGTTQSEGSDSWYGLYERPLNNHGTRASISFTSGKTNVAAGPDDSLDVDGNSESLTLKIEHLLYFSKRASLYASIGYRYSNSESFFVGSFLDDTRSNTAFIELTYDSVDDYGSWYGEASLSAGSASRFDEADQGYTNFNLSAERLQKMGDHWSANLRLAGQLGDDTRLPSSESFFIGGQSTVRGYEEGAAIGVHGVNVNLELSTMPFRRLQLDEDNTLNNIRLTLFTDHGSVYTDKGGGTGLDSDSLSSYGAALLYQPTADLVLSLSYADPIDIDRDFYEERNWSASIKYNLTF